MVFSAYPEPSSSLKALETPDWEPGGPGACLSSVLTNQGGRCVLTSLAGYVTLVKSINLLVPMNGDNAISNQSPRRVPGPY